MTNEQITAARGRAMQQVQLGNPYFDDDGVRVVACDVVVVTDEGGEVFVTFHQIGHRNAKQVLTLSDFLARHKLAIGDVQPPRRLQQRRAG